MSPPQLIAERFQLEELAGRGGMGSVYRAVDLVNGEKVAVKLLREPDQTSLARFEAEARVLADLKHPHIVRYIAHGLTGDHEPYLAMEWLEGETLAERLAREPLRVEEALSLVRKVAEALAAAHARAIVHRDIKPSNIFLVQSRRDLIKVLDFGLARVIGTSCWFSMTGNAVGTPGYMAPEQARGERERIDARADIFSLGCVLFECLTGKAPFRGIHLMAVLARLLMDEPPRLLELRPDLPASLSDLLSRMMAKNPADRPANGAALLQQLAAIDLVAPESNAPISEISPTNEALTDKEQRLLSIVAALPAQQSRAEATSSTMLAFSPERLERIRALGALVGARVVELVTGAVLFVLSGVGSATDQAARAARAALRLRALLPNAKLALVTGRGETHGRKVIGGIVERAASVLASKVTTVGAVVRIDPNTHALLDARFEVEPTGDGFVLLGEREVGDEVRRLLGKPSPYVGRERELRTLRSLLGESFDEAPGARAIVVTGPAGIGKSRMRQELVRMLRESRPSALIGVGRADSMSPGSAYSLVGSAMSQAMGLSGGEPLPLLRKRLQAWVEGIMRGSDRSRIAAFLGELVGVPFLDEHEPSLWHARQNAELMAEHITEAFTELLRAVCARGPVLLVLEDLHAGDAASLRLIDYALRELEDQPFVVLAFARPEVYSIFPSLWNKRPVEHVRVGALPPRAVTHLVRSALGDTISDAEMARLIQRSEGNAFYIEELIRAFAERRGDRLPETVLGMVEERISALPADARRLLRAASIFGEVFWKSGLIALLGEADREIVSSEWLPWLLSAEFVAERSESRFRGEEEYAFRHALIRECSYAMLTERDKVLGHRLAAEWLRAVGEKQGITEGTEGRIVEAHHAIVGEHFMRGEAWEEAFQHFTMAGDAAGRLDATNEALAHYDNASVALERLTNTQ